MAKQKSSGFRKLIGKLHLWLGLSSGLVVLFVALTGCIYTFQEEIQDLTQPWRFVEKQDTAYLMPSRLKEIAAAQVPGLPVQRTYYYAPDRAAMTMLWGKDGKYYSVFINQYTGEVLKVKNLRKDFFTIILYLHFSLLLGETGELIVSTATLIFLIMIISGIILWWPRNKAARKQRFSIKWNARWRRVNYDLHNVLGFYMTWVIIFVAITGLVWGFQWFAQSFYWVTSGGQALPEEQRAFSDTTLSIPANAQAVDKAWLQVMKEHPEISYSAVGYPVKAESPVDVYINPDMGTYYKMETFHFDQYTLAPVAANDHRSTSYSGSKLADKIRRMNYDIHVGAILGLPGKIMVFFAGLICASLPVTGFMVWRGRRKKKKEKQQGREIKHKKQAGPVATKVVRLKEKVPA